jgi:cytochrome c553
MQEWTRAKSCLMRREKTTVMRWVIGMCAASIVVASSLSLVGAKAPADPSSELPLWAYPVSEAARAGNAPAADKTLLHVPNSTAAYTKAQLADLFMVPDWFPASHPPMPPVVAEGQKPEMGACGHCHLPNGLGRPENSGIAGLPEAYILEQMNDMKQGLRHSSETRMPSVNNMIRAAKAATPEEMQAGVKYFASLKPQRWIRVVEADTVPKTHISGGMLIVDPGPVEPIGERIIEVSEDIEQTELRNPTSGFIAYVPKGSLKAGEALVRAGGDGKTMPCAMCHGPNLQGTANVPSIAGRSPSQLARQLIDFQRGARNGAGAMMMKAPVAKLTNADIVAVTGYLASLEP